MTEAIARASRRRGDTLASVRLVVNPGTDPHFARRAETLLEAAASPEELERLLRDEFHAVRVVRGVTDIVERWYAYRDGHWVNSSRR